MIAVKRRVCAEGSVSRGRKARSRAAACSSSIAQATVRYTGPTHWDTISIRPSSRVAAKALSAATTGPTYPRTRPASSMWHTSEKCLMASFRVRAGGTKDTPGGELITRMSSPQKRSVYSGVSSFSNFTMPSSAAIQTLVSESPCM